MERDEIAKRRAYRRKKARKRHMIIAFIIFLIIAISLLITLSLTVFFPIKNVSYSGNKVYSGKELDEYLGIKGKNFFTVSEKKVVENAREKMPYLESIKIKRKFPDTVTVEITEAIEFAAYNIDGKYYVVSKNDYVLAKKSVIPENITEIKAKSVTAEIGQKVKFSDSTVKSIVDTIIKELGNKKISIDYIDVTSKVDIRAGIMDGRFNVNFGTKQNLSEKISHLAVMVEKIDEGEKGSINLSSWSESDPTGIFKKE